jgi:hypothetical protein
VRKKEGPETSGVLGIPCGAKKQGHLGKASVFLFPEGTHPQRSVMCRLGLTCAPHTVPDYPPGARHPLGRHCLYTVLAQLAGWAEGAQSDHLVPPEAQGAET